MGEPLEQEPTQSRPLPWLWLVIGGALIFGGALLFWPHEQEPTNVPAPMLDPPPTPVVLAPDAGVPPSETPEATPASATRDTPPEFTERPKVKSELGSQSDQRKKAVRDLGDHSLSTPEAFADLGAPLEPIPPPRRDNSKRPIQKAATRLPPPDRRSVEASIGRLSRCATMKGCVDEARGSLAPFGANESITDPGVATIAKFKDTNAAYRRAHADVLRNARTFAETAEGAKHETELRRIFEAMPQWDSWRLEEAELDPIEAHLQRAVLRFLAAERMDVRRTISVMISALTAAPGAELQAEIKVESGPVTADQREALEEFVRKELEAIRQLAQPKRQRLASFKLVVNPAQSVSLK